MTESQVVSDTTLQHASGALVSPQWLAAHVDDANVRVVEVDVSTARFEQWHIDGAVLWNIYADLKDGDYRLLDRAAFAALLVRSGITPDSTVVFYGYAPALGFWLMRLHGHRDVRVLDASRDTWRAEGYQFSQDATLPPNGSYHVGEPDHAVRAVRADVEAALEERSATLVDVRSEAEYRGERFWPSGAPEPNGRAGHIPGAVHAPIDDLYDSRGAFRSNDELRALFAAIPLDGDGELITYCTIGGRAATAWFVLTQMLGRDHVRVYDGSWAEWGHAGDTAVSQC